MKVKTLNDAERWEKLRLSHKSDRSSGTFGCYQEWDARCTGKAFMASLSIYQDSHLHQQTWTLRGLRHWRRPQYHAPLHPTCTACRHSWRGPSRSRTMYPNMGPLESWETLFDLTFPLHLFMTDYWCQPLHCSGVYMCGSITRTLSVVLFRVQRLRE